MSENETNSAKPHAKEKPYDYMSLLLDVRVHLLNFVIPIVIASVILWMGFAISREIADDSALRISRQYSVEAAANFQVYMNPHMILMNQMSYSTAIARWLDNEFDEVAKAAAFEAMMGHAATWPYAYFMFTVAETLRGYNFNVNLTLDEFESWGQLSGGEVSQWFFDARDSEMPFILNIQRSRPDEHGNWDLYIWSNHRVYYQGRFVGVFTIGSPFTDVFDATFGGFYLEHRRGYLIDKYGNVRIDSAGELETTADGLPAFPPVPEAEVNPELRDALYNHRFCLQNGMFQLGTPTSDAIRLDVGAFSYGSITPIIGTDWSIVVLSSHDDMLDMRYMLVIIVTVGLLALSAIGGNFLVRSMMREINNLRTQEVEEARRKSEAEVAKVQAEKVLQEERQSKELAEASSMAKSSFLARMSHEIRTPITAVMGVSEIELHNPALPIQTAESFSKVYNAANALLGIVNDILDLSKIEAGKFEIIGEKYEVASMIVDASHIQQSHVGRKNIGFSVHVDESLPTNLEGDPIRIIQVISNLLSNAFKYTMEGTVGLSFSCEKDSEDAEKITLVISISDSGLGMTPEQVNDLSNEYTRYHENEYRFIEGTGLGMPIVFSLVKMMGAEVEISSKVNEGTSVVVKIPQKALSENVLGKDLALRLEQLEENTLSVRKRFSFEPESMPYGKVMVVDDVEENLYVAKGLLAFYDLEIVTCKSGYEAISRVKNGEVYDIVFMDYMMPGISGTDAMLQMRELGYDAPIVVLTANAMIGKAEEFMKDGFDGFMSKPIQTKSLNSTLIKYIKNKQPPEVIEAALKASAENPAKKRDIHSFQTNPELLEKLRADFSRGHSDAFSKLLKQLDEGDIATAHRTAHTIKGAAGLIYENELLEAAFDVEQKLVMRRQPTKKELSALEQELERVLSDIGEVKAETIAESEMLSKAEALALLEKVTPLLLDRSADIVNMLDELRRIPGSDDLCRQIQDFDFASAHETAVGMMGELG
ncbi:MAG: response regulator [Oscillospiraceae bacterium]|nr:response regulator [Oscillospiraceae bacterium]